MSFLTRLLSQNMSVNDERAWTGLGLGTATASREVVSQQTALKISTWYACLRLVSDSVAMLPKFVYERVSETERRRAENHPLYDLVHSQPNQKQTSFEFFQMMTAQAASVGDAYAKIVPGVRGFVDQLIPLLPHKVRIEPLPEGKYRYQVTEPDGSQKPYNDEDILHLRGPTLDGIRGINLIENGRESIGLSLAAQKYSARFYGNDASPGGVLKSKGKLSQEAQTRLKASWRDAHSGINQHQVAVLEEGMDWQAVGIDPRAAQFIEREEFQAEDLCRWQGVPPPMVGLTNKASSWASSSEQMSIWYVTYTLMRWNTAWEQAISRDLILAPKKYFVRFEPMMLLRGDSQARYNVYKIASELGVLNPNEIRALEDMNPREDGGGDKYVEDMGRSLAKPAPEPDEEAAQGANPHYAALLRETAARIVRKESLALTKATQKNGSARAWEKAVHEFYSDHAEFVAQALCVSYEAAQYYVAEQVRGLLADGISALDEEQSIGVLMGVAQNV